MATVTITENTVDVEFNTWERAWVWRERFTFPLAAIRQVACADQPLRIVRGARRGFVISSHTKIGVWGILHRPRQLVSVRHGLPGLHLKLDRALAGGEFDEVVLSLENAAELADTLRRAVRVAA